MALSEGQATDTAKRLLELRKHEQPRLEKIARYMRNEPESVYVPKGARSEYRWMLERAKVNVLPLVVTVVAQALYVDGYRPAKKEDNAAAWKIWQANGMDARQHGLHRSALKYGVGYTVVLPGSAADGSSVPVIKPKSPRRLTAFYEDPVDDEWPIFAVEVTTLNQPSGKPKRVVRLYDDTARYTLVGRAEEGAKLAPDGADWMVTHDLGVCPVVRYRDGDDLDGEECVRGEIEPLIAMQDQLNSTVFGRMMAEQYSAFRQRWVTGMVSEDEEGRPQAPFQAMVDRVWASEDPDTKFGEFSETSLAGYLNSAESTIRHIATVSQTPPHHLLGQIANLSAEALAAAESGLQRKIDERKSLFGEAHEQTLRLAAHAAGDDTGWTDMSAQVVWRDTEARSLAQTVDALGKLAAQLKVPPQMLWERIPGVTQTDVARWKAAADQQDAMAQLNDMLSRQLSPANGTAQQQPVEPAPPAIPAG